jgi:hypothetical protein
MARFLSIKLQDGNVLNTAINAVGRGYVGTDYDWAIYEVLSKDEIAYVETSNKTKWRNKNYDARIIGYGSLKIMSDKEINVLKEKYIRYLKNRKNIKSNGSEIRYGWYHDGIDTKNQYVRNFIANLSPSYYKNIFEDGEHLKVSYCTYSSNGERKNCQSWTGNSGGGIFDDEGNLMAIHHSGYHIIGGTYHASPDIPGMINEHTVNLLKGPVKKIVGSEQIKPN